MRTIKFRGKNTKGVRLYGDLEHRVDDGVEMTYIFDGASGQGGAVIPETVGQFTGLTDKNGKEIYEGDVATDGKYIYTVEFSLWSYAFVWSRHGSQNAFHFEKSDSQEMEVIGNIHDTLAVTPWQEEDRTRTPPHSMDTTQRTSEVCRTFGTQCV